MPSTIIIKTFKLIAHEVLGYSIMICKRQNDILLAYASQKYSMMKNHRYYIAKQLRRVSTVTDRSIVNHIIIVFKALLIPMNIEDCIKTQKLVYLQDDDVIEEVDVRVTI